MALIGFTDTPERVADIKAYYTAKGYRTASGFLRKVVIQYMTAYPVRAQECTTKTILSLIPELKELVKQIIREELKNYE